MSNRESLKVILIKPSKYGLDGLVERFRKGFMPNATLLHLRSMTPAQLFDTSIDVATIDEYTQTDLRYLKLLRRETCGLLGIVGVQSHQIHRALDLCALAMINGVRCCVIGGPHPMTCDTTEVQGRGISFALAEAELVWSSILKDAITCQLRPLYGIEQRWQRQLESPALLPPSSAELKSYIVPMVGIYPARGCPFSCSFCSVVKIAGRKVRGEPIETTIKSLLAAKAAGAHLVMFTSDNFNKYASARSLLNALVEERISLPFLVQCDVQLARDEGFIELLARAGCVQVFIGVESFNRTTLKSVRKFQNEPSSYGDLVRRCHRHGISTHFSSIIGFPEQEEVDIITHLHELRAIRPFMASFYILTPIPGTDQYDDFLRRGLITERNLDRFDATCSVWRHPSLEAKRLQQLLGHCYSKFYSMDDILEKLIFHKWKASGLVYGLGLSYPIYARQAVSRGLHPMAGGLWRVELDRLEDYIALRRKVLGIDQLSLPTSLQLSATTDQALYRSPNN
jgi:Radical SAM superfamily